MIQVRAATLKRTTLKRGKVAVFKPEKTKENNAKANAAIQFAQDVHDWETLEIAVAQKLKDQTEFIAWWKETVTPNKGGDRHKGEKRGTALFVSEAENLTEIRQQQVSKWKRRLEIPEAYREMLYGAAYAKAMAERTDQRGASGTGENDWHTPAEYLDAARYVLGSGDYLSFQAYMDAGWVARRVETSRRREVLSANIHRRHMTKGQRAMAVAKIYPEVEQGKRTTSFATKEVNAHPSKGCGEATTACCWSIRPGASKTIPSRA